MLDPYVSLYYSSIRPQLQSLELPLKLLSILNDENDEVYIFQFQSLYKTVSRDGSRSPMQWSGIENGGFTSGKETWLPVHPNYVINNVQVCSSGLGYVVYRYRMTVLACLFHRWQRLRSSKSTEQLSLNWLT